MQTRTYISPVTINHGHDNTDATDGSWTWCSQTDMLVFLVRGDDWQIQSDLDIIIIDSIINGWCTMMTNIIKHDVMMHERAQHNFTKNSFILTFTRHKWMSAQKGSGIQLCASEKSLAYYHIHVRYVVSLGEFHANFGNITNSWSIIYHDSRSRIFLKF